MKIAVTSQNRREITEHAGRCRKFWIYTVENNHVTGRELLELPKEQSFHESDPHAPHPLDGVDVLISRSMGQGMLRRISSKEILGVITDETSPDAAVTAYLEGRLQAQTQGVGCQHDHGHHHHS